MAKTLGNSAIAVAVSCRYRRVELNLRHRRLSPDEMRRVFSKPAVQPEAFNRTWTGDGRFAERVPPFLEKYFLRAD
jgi:hypothetical protein